jgi:hypothetical protein
LTRPLDPRVLGGRGRRATGANSRAERIAAIGGRLDRAVRRHFG